MATAPDRAEIGQIVQLHIDGTRDGDSSKLREAFDERAWMFGCLGGHRFDVPISELFAMNDGDPADVGGSYQAQIASIEQVGDAATVILEEDGFWGSVSFTDFFELPRIDGVLSRIDGEWKIVNRPSLIPEASRRRCNEKDDSGRCRGYNRSSAGGATRNQGGSMTHQPKRSITGLMIASCLPVVLVIGTVLIITGGFNASFTAPAIVVGAMVGLLTFVTMRDRHLNYPGRRLPAGGSGRQI